MTNSNKSKRTPEQSSAAARKAWVTRKANADRKAIESAQAEALRQHCALCGCENEQTEVPECNRWNRQPTGRTTTENTVQLRGSRGLYLCANCADGLLSDGTYAAVAVAHELRACKRGAAMACHPDIEPLLKSNRIECADGWITLPPYLPKVSDGITYAAAIKQHKKSASERPAPDPEQPAEPVQQQEIAA